MLVFGRRADSSSSVQIDGAHVEGKTIEDFRSSESLFLWVPRICAAVTVGALVYLLIFVLVPTREKEARPTAM